MTVPTAYIRGVLVDPQACVFLEQHLGLQFRKLRNSDAIDGNDNVENVLWGIYWVAKNYGNRVNATSSETSSRPAVEWLSTEEAAVLLNLQPDTVRKLIRDGLIVAEKHAGRHRIDPADLENYRTRAI